MHKKFSSKTNPLKRLMTATLALIMALSMTIVPSSQLAFADESSLEYTDYIEVPDVDSVIDEATEVEIDEATEADSDIITEVDPDEATEVDADEATEVDADEATEVDTDEVTEADLDAVVSEADVALQDFAARAINTSTGINVSKKVSEGGWTGANIIMGNDSSQWPFSAGGGEPVAFTPEKDAVYSLSYNVTSTGASGFRIRWINGNESAGYTSQDDKTVNNNKYAADEVAAKVPAYFENTISSGETKTFNVDFTMDGNEAVGGLIGNIAIRGQSGNNDFDINWISIADSNGNLLAYWVKSSNVDIPVPNTSTGINISKKVSEGGWTGANIIMGNDSSQWPFSSGGGEPVAFTPKKDAVYSLSYNVTSTGASGFRIRWINGNESAGYTSQDDKTVNNNKYADDEVAVKVPAYFENTISSGETKTFNVDFTMDGNEAVGGLIGNIAIRGQGGNNDFDINWISIKDSNGNLLAYREPTLGQVATPELPKAGTFKDAKIIEITTTTVDATIYYTTDGSTPTAASQLYTVPFTITSTTTIKAMAVKDSYSDSAVASATYTEGLPSGSVAGLNWDQYAPLHSIYKDYFLIGLMDSPSNSMAEDRKNLINYHFNSLTPGNALKPSSVQSTKGQFVFAPAWEIFNNVPSMAWIGHTLGWKSQSPDWMWGGSSFNITKEEALENIKSHVTAVMEEFGEDLHTMDVVNEAMGGGNPANWKTALDNSGWNLVPGLGSDWVEEFFKAAADVVDAEGWDCKLYYNDFGLDGLNKATAVYNMVKEINEKYADYRPNGKKLIEGIGMQGHYSGSTSVASVRKSLELFNNLDGVVVSFTELDIAYAVADGSGILSENQAKAQGFKYAQLFMLFKEYAAGSANKDTSKQLIERVSICGAQDRTDGGWLSGSAPTLFGLQRQGKEALIAVINPESYIQDIIDGPQIEFPNESIMYGSPIIGTDDALWKTTGSFDVTTDPIKNNMGGAEATGKAKVMWDDKYLYVNVEVQDSNLTKNSEAAHEKDSVEVFVSEKNNRGTNTGTGGDNQYRVAYDGTKSVKGGSTASFEAAAKEIAGGYLVELKIPFIDVKPSSGSIIGFDIQINDCDGTNRKLTIWSDLAANGYNSTLDWGTLTFVKEIPGVYVYAKVNGDEWSGANIILGNNATQWPWSTASADGKVAFVPEKDATYRLTFNVKSLGAGGYRIRWIKDSQHGYTSGDTAVVNGHPFTADQIGKVIPSNVTGIIGSNIDTCVVEFKMSGDAQAEGLAGNIAIRGFSGANEFVINWIKIEKLEGGNAQLLVDWPGGAAEEPDPEPEPEPDPEVVYAIQFGDDDKAIYGESFKAVGQGGPHATYEWINKSGIGHDDDFVLKGTHTGTSYTSADNVVRFTLPEPLKKGGVYKVSYWVYVPSEGNEGKGTLTGPGFVINDGYAGASGVTKFPASAGTISKGQWKQVNVTLPRIETEPITIIDFRFVVNDAPNHPDVWYIDDIAIELLSMEETPDMVWDLDLPSLKDTYKDMFLFGNILEPGNLNDTELLEMFKNQYNTITAENAMKPSTLSSAKGVYNYESADKLVDWALNNKIAVHAHALVWHSQSPAWVNPAGTTRAQAQANLKEFIDNVAGHYAGKVISWDVANEVFVDGGSGDWKNQIRKDATNGLWYNAYANGADTSKGESGVDYIYDAFVFTRLADPDAVLYYNDYNDDSVGKSTAIAAMVVELNNKWKTDPRNTEQGRLLIEGIGLQSHYGSGTSVANVEASINRFIDTGARISVSELDATRYNGKSGLTEAEEKEQAIFYAQLFEVYVKYTENIDRVTLWGREDRTSWRASGHPTLFDKYYGAKEAFYAAIDPYAYQGKDAPGALAPDADITYTAVADGSADVTTSSKITLTFSKAISGLTIANLSFEKGNTGVTIGEVKRISGTVYELTLKEAVAAKGDVKVSIDKLGIEASTKTVAIHMEKTGGEPEEPVTITYTAVADGTADVTTSRKIILTFSKAISSLTIADITFDKGNTGITIGAVKRISDTVYELTLAGTVTAKGEVKVSIDKSSIEALTKTIAIHMKKPSSGTEDPAPSNPDTSSSGGSSNTPAPAQPDKVITSTDSSKIIQDALNSKKAPEIVIDNKSKGVELIGKDIVSNASGGSNLEIKNGQTQITITPAIIKDLGINEASKVEIVLTPNIKAVDKALDQKLNEVDKINKSLSSTIVDLGIKVDDKNAVKTKAPVKVTIDTSKLKLTDEQKKNFTGVYFDNDLKTYVQLGGEFSEDGKSFVFHTYNEGKVGAIVSDKVDKIKLTIDSKTVNVNGRVIANDVAPIIIEDRTIVPLRVIAESLGADIDWDGDTGTVTVTKGDKKISIKIGEALPDEMGTAQIIDDRTYVPVRYILEQLGANVVWDEADRSVSIYQ